jgi:hypothetical protein
VISDIEIEVVSAWCRRRSAPDEYLVEVQRGRGVLTIVERRPPWNPHAGAEWSSTPIARLRRAKADGTWTLAWLRASGAWLAYDGLAPSPRVEDLLGEIERDPDGVFWS